MLDTEDKFSQVLDREGGKDDEGERWWEGEGKGEQRERETILPPLSKSITIH